MKIKDLLLELKDADPEAEVRFVMRDGCCSERFYLDCKDVSYDNMSKYHQPDLTFWFDSLPHFNTCRLSGMMNDTLKKYEDDMKAWHESQKKKGDT